MIRTGVAISTTGERLDLLRRSVEHWDRCLPENASLFVTVDGTEERVAKVEACVEEWTRSVGRVGQPDIEDVRLLSGAVIPASTLRGGRLGVAANKNTGLEYLMDAAHCDRLWLSDDDSWPLSPASLIAHYNTGLPHSLVCWGSHRRSHESRGAVSNWRWPRGAVMYVARDVVETVGGMIEAFAHGGHEHVEWSTRIHNAGFTPFPFPSPISYRLNGFLGARRFWHCEDMPLSNESLPMLRRRRDTFTTLRRLDGDEARSAKIMEAAQGSTTYVPYRAEDNRRMSATMSGT
jgi:hypothetical protein